MDPIIQKLLILGFVVILTSFAGSLLPFFFYSKKKALNTFVSFGAGVLIAAAFVHMVPEALNLMLYKAREASIWILVGFLLLFVLERFIMIHPCEELECNFHYLGWTAFIGLSIHSLTAGVALGASMLEENLGYLVFLAIITHQLPEAFSLSSLLAVSGFKKKKTIVLVFLYSLMIPIGSILAVYSLRVLPAKVVGIALAISAGTFLHISTSDLLPTIHKVEKDRYINLIAFLLGLFSMIFLPEFLPH